VAEGWMMTERFLLMLEEPKFFVAGVNEVLESVNVLVGTDSNSARSQLDNKEHF
jgi:hypothetical protein